MFDLGYPVHIFSLLQCDGNPYLRNESHVDLHLSGLWGKKIENVHALYHCCIFSLRSCLHGLLRLNGCLSISNPPSSEPQTYMFAEMRYFPSPLPSFPLPFPFATHSPPHHPPYPPTEQLSRSPKVPTSSNTSTASRPRRKNPPWSPSARSSARRWRRRSRSRDSCR